ncbi:unnamed protein product, partial [Durusdinium trenchii]
NTRHSHQTHAELMTALRLLGSVQALGRRSAFASLSAKLPRHRSRRAVKPAETGEATQLGSLPEWLFEDRPVWVEALLRFLGEPNLLVVRLGGAKRNQHLRPAKGRVPELQELSMPSEELRGWARQELQKAADEGRQAGPCPLA